MLSLIAAAALMQPVAAAPSSDPDLRCMAAYLFAVGKMGDDPKTTAEEKSGAISIVMYFFGKVRGKNPKLDIKSGIQRLVEAPDYIERQLTPDLDRCGQEFEERGKELGEFGDD